MASGRFLGCLVILRVYCLYSTLSHRPKTHVRQHGEPSGLAMSSDSRSSTLQSFVAAYAVCIASALLARDGISAFHAACLQGRIQTAVLLLESGEFDVDASLAYDDVYPHGLVKKENANTEYTPLWTAFVGNQWDCCLLLLQRGADINATIRKHKKLDRGTTQTLRTEFC